MSERGVSGDWIERVRAICLALPEATERLSHGEPTFFVNGKKVFVTCADHHHDDRLAIWCSAPEGFQRMLVEAAPDRFFVPPYVGPKGWVGLRLDTPRVNWREVKNLAFAAYYLTAPDSLRKTLR